MSTLSQSGIAEALCSYFAETVELTRDEYGLVALMPHKDLFGDSIMLHLDAVGGNIVLSDGGFAHHELVALTGSTKPDADVWTRVTEVANRYGVEFDGGELNTVATDSTDLGRAAFALANTIAESLHAARASVPSVGIQFSEEVELFFSDHDIRHETGVKLPGVSGAKHRIDFALQNSRYHVAQAIASEQSMRRSINIFYDLTELDKTIQPIAFVDDERGGYSSATFQQLAYKSRVFEWRRRDDFVDYWRKAHSSR